MENKFCYLKGIVDCDSGRIQDCNNKRTVTCILDQEQKQNEKPASKSKYSSKNTTHSNEKTDSNNKNFCFLMGMVECSLGRVQDCNIKRVKNCPKA